MTLIIQKEYLVVYSALFRFQMLLAFSMTLLFLPITHAETNTTSAHISPSTVIVDTATSPAQKLVSNNFDEKLVALEILASNGNSQLDSFRALSEGRLYSDGNQLWIKSTQGEQFAPTQNPDQITDKPANVKKIMINNKIRVWLKNYLAQFALSDNNPTVRKKAMEEVLAKNDSASLPLVQAALAKENHASIRILMETYVARMDLSSQDTARHYHALNILAEHASPENLAILQNYARTAPTETLKKQAEKAVSSLETKLSLLQGAETFSFGLSLGSVLVLTAIGLAITFGVMGVINMAHGELMMIGAYCAYVVQLLMPNHIGASVLVAIPVAFAVSGLVGILIERLVVRHLYGRPLETLLATFGISLILQQAVRSIFSPLNRMVQTPDWMSGSLEIINGLSITWNRIYIFFFCLACFLALWAVMKRTRLGLEVRAVSMNRNMARAVGISDRKVDMLTFGLGSGIAGVAGVALSQLANVGPNLGQQYIVDSFMVVVVGGVSNLWGTLVSGLMLGVLNKMMEPWLGAVLAKAVMLVVIILFIQKFPRGLFPQKGRGVE